MDLNVTPGYVDVATISETNIPGVWTALIRDKYGYLTTRLAADALPKYGTVFNGIIIRKYDINGSTLTIYGEKAGNSAGLVRSDVETVNGISQAMVPIVVCVGVVALMASLFGGQK